MKWVRVVGVIVAIDDFAGRRAWTIDDSSGQCIEAVKPFSETNERPGSGHSLFKGAKQTPPYEEIDVGDVVDVKGSLSKFRHEMQIKVEKMAVVETTEREMVLWEKRAAFRRSVLLLPWKLDKKVVRRCQREAERDQSKKKKRSKQPTTNKEA